VQLFGDWALGIKKSVELVVELDQMSPLGQVPWVVFGSLYQA